MDNHQFRQLLLSNASRQTQQDSAQRPPAAHLPAAVLGLKKHASLGMTPRQASRTALQADFARQLAARNAKARPALKARSSAPKGTRLAAGYTDRVQARAAAADDDGDSSDLAQRIQKLEDSVKQGELDRPTFERLVLDLAGGDLGTTHLVKGLDRNLLARVRRGEDLHASASSESQSDIENALDELAVARADPLLRDKSDKQGKRLASPPPVVGVKRSRNDLLKELRRQREDAAQAAAAEHQRKYPELGPGFRKVNAQGETLRIEIDDQGRDILIITGPDGKEKRKIRKSKVDEQSALSTRSDIDDVRKPINMHNLPKVAKEESEDEDIFQGVGSDYNPLADLQSDMDGSEDDSPSVIVPPCSAQSLAHSAQPLDSGKTYMKVLNDVIAPSAFTRRDYFKSATADSNSSDFSAIASADASIRAALGKVRSLDGESALLQNLSRGSSEPEAVETRLKKRAAELASRDRDMEDLDLGFGESRFDDVEDMERDGQNIKLSEWKGVGADGDDASTNAPAHSKKRKRGPKKGGDKNKAEDVLKTMERQRHKKALG